MGNIPSAVTGIADRVNGSDHSFPVIFNEKLVVPMSNDFHFSSAFPKEMSALFEEWGVTKEMYHELFLSADKISSGLGYTYGASTMVAHPQGDTSTAFTDALVKLDRAKRGKMAKGAVVAELKNLLASYQLINPIIALEIHGVDSTGERTHCSCPFDGIHITLGRHSIMSRVNSGQSLGSMTGSVTSVSQSHHPHPVSTLPGGIPTGDMLDLSRTVPSSVNNLYAMGQSMPHANYSANNLYAMGSTSRRNSGFNESSMSGVRTQPNSSGNLHSMNNRYNSGRMYAPTPRRSSMTRASVDGGDGLEDGNYVTGEGEEIIKERLVELDEWSHRPLKREVSVTKVSGLDFGVRFCRHRGWVYVAEVFANTPGWRIGLQPGDRFEEIGNIPVSTQMRIQDMCCILQNESEVFIRIVDTPLRDVIKGVRVPTHNGGAEIWCHHKGELFSKVDIDGGVCNVDSLVPQGFTIYAINNRLVLGFSGQALWAQILQKIAKRGKVMLHFMPGGLVSELVFAIRSRMKREEQISGAAGAHMGGTSLLQGSMHIF